MSSSSCEVTGAWWEFANVESKRSLELDLLLVFTLEDDWPLTDPWVVSEVVCTDWMEALELLVMILLLEQIRSLEPDELFRVLDLCFLSTHVWRFLEGEISFNEVSWSSEFEVEIHGECLFWTQSVSGQSGCCNCNIVGFSIFCLPLWYSSTGSISRAEDKDVNSSICISDGRWYVGGQCDSSGDNTSRKPGYFSTNNSFKMPLFSIS